MTEQELKPCPFCGGDAKATDVTGYDEWLVECNQCAARIHQFINGTEKAIAAWNTRLADLTADYARLKAAAGGMEIMLKQFLGFVEGLEYFGIMPEKVVKPDADGAKAAIDAYQEATR